MMSNDNEYRLNNPPTDVISSVKFGPSDNKHLLTASWDDTVRLYDISSNRLKCQYNHDAPVLDASFQTPDTCWSVGADNKVKKFDFQSENEVTVGYHADPIKSVEYIPDVNIVATGGWDKFLKLWDPRVADSGRSMPVGSHILDDKVCSMSVCGDKLIIGLANRRISIWDLRNMSHEERDILLKYQIRCVQAFADNQGFAVSSIEGRVLVDYLDMSPEVQKQKYVFKCHRNKDNILGCEVIYPVNSISFHKIYNSFATGGSDGFVSIWDGKHKKRLAQFRRYPSPIASIGFSPDGTNLAIACSYLSPNEATDPVTNNVRDCIFIRRIGDSEARVKGQ